MARLLRLRWVNIKKKSACVTSDDAETENWKPMQNVLGDDSSTSRHLEIHVRLRWIADALSEVVRETTSCLYAVLSSQIKIDNIKFTKWIPLKIWRNTNKHGRRHRRRRKQIHNSFAIQSGLSAAHHGCVATRIDSHRVNIVSSNGKLLIIMKPQSHAYLNSCLMQAIRRISFKSSWRWSRGLRP